MSVQTTTLTDFLLARIAEDEVAARDAARHARLDVPGPPLVDWSVVRMDYGGISVWEAGSDAGDTTTPVTQHMQRWDPARVLAECDAKRRVVEIMREGEWEAGWTLSDRVLGSLALPYADHPDYRPEWRP